MQSTRPENLSCRIWGRPLERMLLVATFESLKCRVAGGPHGRCREGQFEKQTPARQATRIFCELRPTELCPVRVTSGNGPFS